MKIGDVLISRAEIVKTLRIGFYFLALNDEGNSTYEIDFRK